MPTCIIIRDLDIGKCYKEPCVKKFSIQFDVMQVSCNYNPTDYNSKEALIIHSVNAILV